MTTAASFAWRAAVDVFTNPDYRFLRGAFLQWCSRDYSPSTMTNDEHMQRESSLIATIRKKLPDFANACPDDTELVLLHQDAFAADYQEDEYLLLGMAIKYAGLRRKEVRVIGKNRTSLGEEEKIQ
jgi:hypothetical protein